MEEKRFTLIGKPLSEMELSKFTDEAQISLSAKTAVDTNAVDLIQDQSFHPIDRLSLLMMTQIILKCPVGPHDDPGLNVAVLRACNISKVGSVAIQCTQGHWAEYPCG